MARADSFTVCQTAFAVMPSPHAFPTLLTLRNNLPRSMPAALSHTSNSPHPVRNRDGSNVTSLTHQVDDGPVFLPLLEMIQGQCDGFVSSQPTRKQESQQSASRFPLSRSRSGACQSACP